MKIHNKLIKAGDKMKVGLVLEGGAMRGLYTAGVLDVFLDNKDIKIDTIIGVSAGALFGVNYKSRQKGRTLRYNLKYANDERYMGFKSLVKTGDIVNREFCYDEIPNKLDIFDNDTYKKTPEEFYAVVTNLDTGKPEYIKIDDAQKDLEYLRASGSMPYVSKIVQIDGKKYLDGGTSDSIPVDEMMKMGVDKVIVVLTRPLEYRKKKSSKKISKWYYKRYPNYIDTLNNRYLMYNEEVEKVISLEKEKKIFVIRPSRLVDIKRIERDTLKLKEMYDLGVEDAKNSLKDLKNYLEIKE